MEADDVDKNIEAFVNKHFTSTWLAESPAAAGADDFFDSLFLLTTDPDDLVRLSPDLQPLPNHGRGLTGKRTTLPEKLDHYDHQHQHRPPPLPPPPPPPPQPPSSSSPTLPSSVTSTSIDSTASSSSHILSSFRSVRSLRRLARSDPTPEITTRPHSASFSYYDDEEDDEDNMPLDPSWNQSATSTQTSSNNNHKLTHVIQELIDTEKAYYHDMLLIEEIYMAPSSSECSPWTQQEKKALFGTLLNVLDLEKEFLVLLQDDSEKNKIPAIAKAFLTLMDRMEHVYCAYCKRHHDVVQTINQQQQTRPVVAAFLKRCSNAMAGRTTSWDLGSLLIKPVQRILKYPLLLQEMVSLMMPSPDPDLAAALVGIQRVADRINETKRRKDMMDSIVAEKAEQSSVVHGINKSIARKAHRLKRATGLAPKKPMAAAATPDAEFESLRQQFEDQQRMADQLVKDCLEWVQTVKQMCLQTQAFAASADAFYESPNSPIREFSQVSFECIAGELEHQTQKWIETRVQPYLKLFAKPSLLIAKHARHKRRMDRRRKNNDAADIKDDDDDDNDDDNASFIHAQLVEELPRFLKLAAEFFDVVLDDWTGLQSETYQRFWQEWLRLDRMLPADHNHQQQETTTTILTMRRYGTRIKPILECLDNLGASKRTSVTLDRDLLTWDDFLRAASGSKQQ